ncbi:MAG: glycerate kinase [Rhodobacteraceae bacterium]|nr:glycerate kinase [Paracoccaceae bacterium]
MTLTDPSAFLRDLFDCAVAVADPMTAVPAALPPKPEGRIVVLGAGKASARMAEAVESEWGPCEGLVLTRYGYGRPTKGIEIVEAAHPVPDAAGQAATQRLLDLADSLGPDDFVLCLISGGGSALLTAPLGKITLEEKQAVNAALLRSGAPIDQMNVVRKHLSRVKGGQFAKAVFPAQMLCLLISDVPGDDPAAIASGPTVGEPSRAKDAFAVLERWNIDVPASVRDELAAGSAVVPVDAAELATTTNKVIIAPSQSLDAAAESARAAGVTSRMLGDALEGEARELAERQVEMALEIQRGLSEGEAPVVLLSGGECTVSGRGTGVGGPNAEFALAAALALNGAPGISVLACDTDGVDGAAEVAGAIVTPDTLTRATSIGLDPEAALEAHDSHGFFGQIQGQVVTGPTLTNVNDFRAILIEAV